MTKNYSTDREFSAKHLETVELKKDNKYVLLTPTLQGRVITSSANGPEGYSFGWINYDLIASGKFLPHCNNFGGEDRFWLGPEGGQFSLFFPKGTDYGFDDWQTPPTIDTEVWDLVEKSDDNVKFTKSADITNTSGNTLSLKLDRKVSLLSKSDIEAMLGVEIDPELDWVAFKSENSVTNCGDFEWNKTTGMPSIWILGQFVPSDDNKVIIPIKESTTEVLNDTYFGKIDEDRLEIVDGIAYFKGDGRKRGKIGIPPTMTIPLCGAHDAFNNTLTVTKFTFNSPEDCYVNSMWEHQENPFKGDVINSYNDGPLEDGTVMGPFYEIETSSPALNLKSGESATHINTTIHFTGNSDKLIALKSKVFGCK